MNNAPNPARHPNILVSFKDQTTLDSALSHLEGSCIPRAQLAVRHADTAQQLPTETGDEPLRDDEQRSLRTLRNSTAGVIGALVAAGAVVATGGAAIPAVAIAAAAGLGAGGLSEMVSKVSGVDPQAAGAHGAAMLIVSPASSDQAERVRVALEGMETVSISEEPATA